MSANYEAPVLILSMDTIRNYASEESWEWIQTHPDAIPEILDDAAYDLAMLIEDHSISTALEEAIAQAQSRTSF